MKIKTDFRNLKNSIKKLEKSFPAAKKAIKLEFAGEVVSQIKYRFVPVKYGNLRSTVRVEEKQNNRVYAIAGGIVGKSKKPVFVDYAKYVNDGTSRIAPRRYMEKGAAVAGQKTNSIASRTLASWLRHLN